MMTEARSSGSSTFAKQDTGHQAPPRCYRDFLMSRRSRAPPVLGPNSATRLEGPEDILELLHKFVGWRTIGDIGDARLKYICDKNLNIQEELKKLKGLSAALTSKHEICVARQGKLDKEYDDLFQKHVEKLVEQVPNIKDKPTYDHLPTTSEKYQIEKALQKKVQKKVQEVRQVEDRDLAMHLQGLREILKPKKEECEKECWRLRRIERALSPVNDFVQMLTEEAKQSDVDFYVVIGGKRKRLESQTMDTRQYAPRLDNVVVSQVVVGNEKKKRLESRM